MYCKNCGRELKSEMRFCDRCGQSVRQGKKTESAARREELEALQEDRLNRRRKMAELEAKKAEKKQKRNMLKKKNKKLIYFIAIILLAAVSAIITYIAMSASSNNAAWKTRDGSEALNATAVPTVEPSDNSALNTPVPTTLPIVGVETENTDPVNSDGYRVFTVSDSLSCPYPTVFSKKEAGDNQLLSIFDNTGGASMVIAREKDAVSSQASELLKNYAQKTSGTVLYSLAGDNWFGITTSKNNIITHRKYLIIDGKAIYYSFDYDKNSVSAAEYEKYIEYIDNAFTQ